jgi:hypothetical protein
MNFFSIALNSILSFFNSESKVDDLPNSDHEKLNSNEFNIYNLSKEGIEIEFNSNDCPFCNDQKIVDENEISVFKFNNNNDKTQGSNDHVNFDFNDQNNLKSFVEKPDNYSKYLITDTPNQSGSNNHLNDYSNQNYYDNDGVLIVNFSF